MHNTELTYWTLTLWNAAARNRGWVRCSYVINVIKRNILLWPTSWRLVIIKVIVSTKKHGQVHHSNCSHTWLILIKEQQQQLNRVSTQFPKQNSQPSPNYFFRNVPLCLNSDVYVLGHFSNLIKTIGCCRDYINRQNIKQNPVIQHKIKKNWVSIKCKTSTKSNNTSVFAI